jgi:hypothetical protein
VRRTSTAALTALLAAATGLVAAPADAVNLSASFPVSFACESVPSEEVVLSWDDVTYDLSGICGVVRVTGDRVDVTMPTARRVVVEGQDVAVTSKSLGVLEVTGSGARVHATSAQQVLVNGGGSTVAVDGLLEDASVTGPDAVLSADTVHALRLRSSGAEVTARRAYVVRLPGDANTARLTRADKVVVAGDGNSVSVARGRTVVRDRGEGNAVSVHRRGR